MNKKLLFSTLFTLVLIATNSFAQASDQIREREVIVSTNAFLENWFIDLGVGAQYFNGNYTSGSHFGKKISPFAEISAGKWITPTIGVRAGFKGFELRTVSSKPNQYTPSQPESDGLYRQRWNATNIHADLMLNASSLFYGYQEDMLYNCVPYVGFGVIQNVFNHKPSNKPTNLAGTLGILNSFNVSPSINLYFDATCSVFKNKYSNTGATTADYYISTSVGVTYKFRTRGWRSAKTEVPIYTGVSQEDYNTLFDALRREQTKNRELESAVIIESQKATAATQNVATNTTANPILVTFNMNSAELSKLALVNLEFLAKSINDSKSDTNYAIIGYADIYTGSTTFNEKLSKARAEAVYNALVNRFNVASSRLKVEYRGGVKNMYYNDAQLSRSVIIEPLK